MSANEPNFVQKVRIQFSKTGNAVYISHLDMLRTFTRAIRRAAIPAAYSQGFNPHLLLSFSMPLSLGTASLAEFADLKLASHMEFDAVKESLNKTMPDHIRVIKVMDASASLSEIASSAYTIVFDGAGAQADKLLQEAEELLNGESLVVEKKSKRSVKEVDILPFLLEKHWRLENFQIQLNVRVLSGNEKNLNPNVLIKGIEKFLPAFSNLTHHITKTGVFKADGTEFTQ